MESRQPTLQARIALALSGMVFLLLAFHGLGFLVLVAPGLLALALRGLSPLRKLIASGLWGLAYSGFFNLWAWGLEPPLWYVLVPIRGLQWIFFPLPGILFARWLNRSFFGRGLATAAGLGLVSMGFVATPLGYDWETPMACLSSWPWLLACLPWLGLFGGACLIGFCSHLLVVESGRARGYGALVLGLWCLVSMVIFHQNFHRIGGKEKIALLQTGWQQSEKWKPENRQEARERLFHLSRRAAAEGASLVVWPETAWPVMNLRKRYGDVRMVGDLARELKVELLVSSIEEVRGGWYNSVSQVTSTGRFAAEYRKRRLIPVAEYLPLPKEWVAALRQRDLVLASCKYLQGEKEVIFQQGELRFAVLICFESMVAGASSRLAEEVDFFVVVTNDARVESEFAKEAHFRSAILRAAQFRRPFLQASNNGITGVIDHRGVVIQRTPQEFTKPTLLLVEM